MTENKINIGDLDTLVTIQSCTITRGTSGQKVYSFTDHSRVWAKVDRVYDEGVADRNLEQGDTISLTCYKISALTTRWRVVIGPKAYSINAIDPIDRMSPLNVLTLRAVE